MFNNKYVQAALTVIVVIAVLKAIAPWTSRIPVVGRFVALQ